MQKKQAVCAKSQADVNPSRNYVLPGEEGSPEEEGSLAAGEEGSRAAGEEGSPEEVGSLAAGQGVPSPRGRAGRRMVEGRTCLDPLNFFFS